MKKLRIGVLLDDLEGMYAGNIWPGLLNGKENRGVSLVFYIGRTYWPDREELNRHLFLYDAAANDELDGLIVSGSISIDWNEDRKRDFFSKFSSAGLPVVTLGVKCAGIPNVTSDASGIREAIRYFLQHGRKDIAFVTGRMNLQDSQDRLEAFRTGMAENGLAFREDRIIPGTFTYESGLAAAERILELNGGGMADAVISSNDEMAFGLLNRFAEKGVSVPEEIALVGFDDSEAVQMTRLPIASINPSLENQAELALTELVHWIRDGKKPDDLTVPSRLVVRESMDTGAVSEPRLNDDRSLVQSYRHYLWSFRNLFSYFNKSDNLREVLMSFARYLVPSQNIRYCQIVLFNDPVTGDVDPDKVDCRPVFLNREYKLIYSLGRGGTYSLRRLPDEMKEQDGNFLMMALTHQGIKFGYIVFDFSITDATFVYEELRNIISIFLKNVMDYKSLAFMNRKKEQDMQIARTVQDKFLTFKMTPGKVIDIDTLYEPMMDVSGDFYQITELSDGRIGVFIGDVTGHGMSAAMIASMAIMGMQIYQRTLDDPSEVLARINDQIYSILPDYFLTAFYAVIDLAERTMTFSNAGHPYPFLYRKETGRIEILESGGKLIGCFDDPRLVTRSCRLFPGDRLLIYTDGISECTDSEGREFGEEKLKEVMERNVPFQEFFTELLTELVRFRSDGNFEDDVTAVLIEMKTGPEAAQENGPNEKRSRAKFVPEDGKVLFLFGQDRDSIGEYVETFKKIPAGFTVYTSVRNADGLETAADNGGIQDGQAILDSYPDSVVHIGLSLAGSLDGIAAGDHDWNIDRIGRWIELSKRPVFLRIGYEFDFPQNGYEPEKYISAYRYIADRFRKNHIGNIAYVWHSYAGAPDIPIADWYPGDDCVDWCGVSYFANPVSFMEGMIDFARRHGKPLMVAEATPFGSAVDKGMASWETWFEGVFSFIRSKGVKAFCYIGCDWEKIPMFAGQGWGDARVQADPVVRRNWEKEINGKEFIHAGEGLFRQLGFRKA